MTTPLKPAVVVEQMLQKQPPALVVHQVVVVVVVGPITEGGTVPCGGGLLMGSTCLPINQVQHPNGNVVCVCDVVCV